MAKYSYGIYLTHITALAVFAHALRGQPLGIRLPALAVLLVIPPFVLYHLVEEPMIRLGLNISRSWRNRQTGRLPEQVLNTEPAP